MNTVMSLVFKEKQEMKLSAVEGCFQNYLRTNQLELIKSIVDDNKLSAEERLAIYFDAYRLRLLEILESDYPKLHVLMGDESFECLGREYIDENPSQHFSVRYFGKGLSSFLERFSPYPQHPYLREMAEFEWAMGDTLDARDAIVLASDALQSLPLDHFGDLKIRFHPSMQVLNFKWNTPQLWQAINNEEDERPPEQLPNPVDWIVFRSGLTCVFRSLEENEAIALRALNTSSNIAVVCEILGESMEEEKVPVFILQCLDQWLREGMVSSLEI